MFSSLLFSPTVNCNKLKTVLLYNTAAALKLNVTTETLNSQNKTRISAVLKVGGKCVKHEELKQILTFTTFDYFFTVK